MEGDKITLQDIFLFDFRAGVDANGRHQGRLEPTGVRPSFAEKLEDTGVELTGDMFEAAGSATCASGWRSCADRGDRPDGPRCRSSASSSASASSSRRCSSSAASAPRRAARRPPASPRAHAPGDQRTRRLDQALAASPALRRAVEVTADLAQRRGALGSVERSLRAADVPVRPAELILAQRRGRGRRPDRRVPRHRLAVEDGARASCWPRGGPPLTLRFLAKRRRKRFNAQLPDALTDAGRLAAGRSLGRPGDGGHLAGGARPDGPRAAQGRGRGAPRAAAQRGARRRRRAGRQRRLPVGRARHADPGRGRRQPRRAARPGGRHDAGAHRA